MNRDEILKMEAGRELDALVAEYVMGDELARQVGAPEYATRDMAMDAGDMSLEGMQIGDFDWEQIEPYPYSTDIAAAWDVVEMMRNKVIYKYPVCPNIIYHHTDGLWHCEYFSGDWMRNATAPTAPLAICRAALLAVMEFDG